jgi:hypothetical protein
MLKRYIEAGQRWRGARTTPKLAGSLLPKLPSWARARRRHLPDARIIAHGVQPFPPLPRMRCSVPLRTFVRERACRGNSTERRDPRKHLLQLPLLPAMPSLPEVAPRVKRRQHCMALRDRVNDACIAQRASTTGPEGRSPLRCGGAKGAAPLPGASSAASRHHNLSSPGRHPRQRRFADAITIRQQPQSMR